MKLKISVVIPAYNAEAFITEAIHSVLAQTLSPDEVIIVNDGSSDRTAQITESFGSSLRCLTQENRGLSAARNAGIRAATGELIALLDADDYWLPEKLARQVELLNRQPLALACLTETEYFDDKGRTLRRASAPAPVNLVENLLLHSCVIGPPSAALIRRAAFDKAGLFDPQFNQCGDWDMWLRLAEAGQIVYVHEPLVRYRLHANNMSRNIPLLENDTFGVLDKFFASHRRTPLQRLEKRVYSNHWMILSGAYLHFGQWRDSWRCLWRGLRVWPLNFVRPLGLPARWLKRMFWSPTSLS